jgi:hypothetical protein
MREMNGSVSQIVSLIVVLQNKWNSLFGSPPMVSARCITLNTWEVTSLMLSRSPSTIQDAWADRLVLREVDSLCLVSLIAHVQSAVHRFRFRRRLK